jgi:hypothetical protein
MKTFQRFWQSGPLAKILLALFAGGTAAGVCVICAVCGLALLSTPTSRTATLPVVDVSPTRTPRPENTLVPASTQVPTNTPKPTDTPRPTSTPAKPALTTEELAALSAMATNVSVLGDALTQLGTLASAPRLTDTDWKTSMGIQMALVQIAHRNILALDVPSSLGGVRAAILNATSDCSAAMGPLASGIDKINPSDLARAGVLMKACAAKMAPATAELTAFRDAHQ